ncbi:MAG TPA: helix-turn-helix domain-containing protein [Candidatus Limnocylindrales bacterium]|nr:helix-turn-helix domain-containing protein [Candidatus Limnocylindrales bacterium]
MTTQIRSAMVADVGARIRSLRTAKGLTQAQLADPLYTKAYISMLESGRTRASMKALEHIAGALGVQASDLLGGSAGPSTPQFQLLNARSLLEQGKNTEAVAILEQLEDGLSAADQLMRLRCLAVGYNAVGQPKQTFPVIERAQRMADLLDHAEEKVRLKSVLAATYARTYAYEDSVRLLRECIAACEKGTIKDPGFHFRRVVDLAMMQSAMRQGRQALVTYERAIVLSEQFGDRNTLAALYGGMAKNYENEGDLQLAIEYNQKSLQLYEELGLLDQVACMLDNAALIFSEQGNQQRATECLSRAAALAEQTHGDETLASIRSSEAEILSKTDPEAALAAAQEALKFARKVESIESQVRALVVIGEIKMKSSAAAGKRSFQEASQLADERVPHMHRVIYDRWSRAAEGRGDSEEALRLARRALEAVRT